MMQDGITPLAGERRGNRDAHPPAAPRQGECRMRKPTGNHQVIYGPTA